MTRSSAETQGESRKPEAGSKKKKQESKTLKAKKRTESRKPKTGRRPEAENRKPKGKKKQESKSVQSRKPKVENRKPKAEDRKPKAENRKPKGKKKQQESKSVQSRKPKAESRKPEAESRKRDESESEGDSPDRDSSLPEVAMVVKVCLSSWIRLLVFTSLVMPKWPKCIELISNVMPNASNKGPNSFALSPEEAYLHPRISKNRLTQLPVKLARLSFEKQTKSSKYAAHDNRKALIPMNHREFETLRNV